MRCRPCSAQVRLAQLEGRLWAPDLDHVNAPDEIEHHVTQDPVFGIILNWRAATREAEKHIVFRVDGWPLRRVLRLLISSIHTTGPRR